MAPIPDPNEPLYRLIARNLRDSAVIVFDEELRFLVAEGPALEAAGYSKHMLEGNTLQEVFPDQYNDLYQIYRQVLQGKSFRVERVRGDTVYSASTVPLRDDSGDIHYGMLIIQDVTDHTRLAQQEHEQRIFAEQLTRMLQQLTGSLDIDKVLDSMLEAVGEVVPFDAAAIMVLGETGASIARYQGIDFGVASNLNIDQPFRIENGIILKHLYTLRAPIIVHDMSAPPFPATLFSHFPWIKAYVGVPMVAGDEVVGFIHLASRIESFFLPLHAERLATFATQAAIAIQNARAYEKAKVVAAMEEQRRLAQGLHDSVTQVLFSANMLAHSLPRLWAKGEPIRAEDLDTLGTLTKGALAEMRAMLVELRPETIQTTDLGELIEHLAYMLPARRTVHVTMDMIGTYPLPEAVQTCFYRVAQARLASIAEIQGVTLVKVTLTRTPKDAELLISNDGPSTPQSQGAAPDSAVSALRARAEAIGASVRVEAAADQGTTLRLYWGKASAAAEPTAKG